MGRRIYPVVDKNGQVQEIVVNEDFSDLDSLTEDEQLLLASSPLMLKEVLSIPPRLRSNVDYVFIFNEDEKDVLEPM